MPRMVPEKKMLLRRFSPSRWKFTGRRYTDAAAVLLLLILTVIPQWSLLRGGIVVGMDTATQFYPWYSYLGERLSSGDIPAWNPRLFSGAPFAGDPLSGWTYLPAMLLFTLLPLKAAATSYVFLHSIMAGLFTYALARVLRMGPSGALLAAVAYEFTGYLYVQNTCCFAFASVVAWLPLAILGAELAIKSRRWLNRGLRWGASGLALSQILAAWLGQGSYYALLALGGYVAYRTLVSPPEFIRGVWARLSGLCLHGGAVLLFGFGLAAAGVLPRLEYNALSGLADGYPGSSGGLSIESWNNLFALPGVNYAGAAVLALTLAAPFVARGRHATPYFVVLCLGAITLAGKGFTPLHSALYLLPRFEELHPHYPQRAMMIFYLGAALLAGATLNSLGERGRKASLISLPFLAAIFLASRGGERPVLETSGDSAAPTSLWGAPSAFLSENGISIFPGPFLVLTLVLLLTAAYALLPLRFTTWRGLAATLLALCVFVDLHVAGMSTIESRLGDPGTDRRLKVDLDSYYAPTGATRFLQSEGEEPSRYFGYSPRVNANGGPVPYYIRFANPRTRALETENRAILRDGLQSTQGYNAVHLARYDEYLAALNGQPQHYHDADVFEDGLDSPLLDLLNVRHIVAPADITQSSPRGLRELERDLPTVYQNDTVRVFENREALPRAWIVHSARQEKPEEALKLLGSGEVDPERTALLQEPPPPLSQPDDPSAEEASVSRYAADEMQLDVATGARGLLVLSEVYYPAWKAYVDGEPVALYRADHLLRAVPVPAGEHTVELRFESPALRAGVAISLISYAALIALVAGAAISRSRSGRPTNTTGEP